MIRHLSCAVTITFGFIFLPACGDDKKSFDQGRRFENIRINVCSFDCFAKRVLCQNAAFERFEQDQKAGIELLDAIKTERTSLEDCERKQKSCDDACLPFKE